MPDVIASGPSPEIKEGSKVTLHFSLLLNTGEEVDGTRGGKPASLVIGDGNLLPGFEAAILGLRAGDAEQITIPSLDAFGEHNEANVQTLPKQRFAGLGPQDPLEEGLIVSFRSPDGELPGVVKAVSGDLVTVDFNHPLSGLDIVFDVSIISVEDG